MSNIGNVDFLFGWHLVSAEHWKPGMYRICITRRIGGGAEMINAITGKAILTTARELNYLSAPNGYTLP